MARSCWLRVMQAHKRSHSLSTNLVWCTTNAGFGLDQHTLWRQARRVRLVNDSNCRLYRQALNVSSPSIVRIATRWTKSPRFTQN